MPETRTSDPISFKVAGFAGVWNPQLSAARREPGSMTVTGCSKDAYAQLTEHLALHELGRQNRCRTDIHKLIIWGSYRPLSIDQLALALDRAVEDNYAYFIAYEVGVPEKIAARTANIRFPD